MIKLDLDTVIRNGRGEPFFVAGLDGNAVYALLVQRRTEGVPLDECIKQIEQLAGGKDNIRPLDLGDLLYRANERSPKYVAGQLEDGTKVKREDKRVRGELEEKLCKKGVVEFSKEQEDAMREDCERIYNGAVLVRLDRIFAQALLDAAPKDGPELVVAKDGAA